LYAKTTDPSLLRGSPATQYWVYVEFLTRMVVLPPWSVAQSTRRAKHLRFARYAMLHGEQRVKQLDLVNALGETVKNFNCALEIFVMRYARHHWF
jgi:hypothetical protein